MSNYVYITEKVSQIHVTRSILITNMYGEVKAFTHCGLVMQHGNIDVGQH